MLMPTMESLILEMKLDMLVISSFCSNILNVMNPEVKAKDVVMNSLLILKKIERHNKGIKM